MRLSGKRFYNQQTGKRLLSFFMALLIAIGCIGTLPAASAATATQTNPVVFKVRGAIDTNVSNGVKYSITVSEVYNSTLGYQSFSISYPTELAINTSAISTTTDWTISGSDGNCSFNLNSGVAAKTANEIKNVIESIYFTLTTADAYPDEGSTVGITAYERL